jgi:hypothetical protein
VRNVPSGRRCIETTFWSIVSVTPPSASVSRDSPAKFRIAPAWNVLIPVYAEIVLVSSS